MVVQSEVRTVARQAEVCIQFSAKAVIARPTEEKDRMEYLVLKKASRASSEDPYLQQNPYDLAGGKIPRGHVVLLIDQLFKGFGKQLFKALRREVRAETGLEVVEQGILLGQHQFLSGTGNPTLQWIVSVTVSDPHRRVELSDEHVEPAAWIRVTELDGYGMEARYRSAIQTHSALTITPNGVVAKKIA